MFLAIMFGVMIIYLLWDSRNDRLNQEKREKILFEIDAHRMKEIKDLKEEISRLKTI